MGAGGRRQKEIEFIFGAKKCVERFWPKLATPAISCRGLLVLILGGKGLAGWTGKQYVRK